MQGEDGREAICQEVRARHSGVFKYKMEIKAFFSFFSCAKFPYCTACHCLMDLYHGIFYQAVLDLDRAVSWE